MIVTARVILGLRHSIQNAGAATAGADTFLGRTGARNERFRKVGAFRGDAAHADQVVQRGWRSSNARNALDVPFSVRPCVRAVEQTPSQLRVLVEGEEGGFRSLLTWVLRASNHGGVLSAHQPLTKPECGRGLFCRPPKANQ